MNGSDGGDGDGSAEVAVFLLVVVLLGMMASLR